MEHFSQNTLILAEEAAPFKGTARSKNGDLVREMSPKNQEYLTPATVFSHKKGSTSVNLQEMSLSIMRTFQQRRSSARAKLTATIHHKKFFLTTRR
jgi:hypothetical protein